MAILDTADIRAQMLAGRDADKWQMKCMSFLSDTMNVLKTIAELKYMGNDDAEGHRLVVMQTLAILIRDIMECSLLLDLFSRKPEHLQPWIDRGTDAGKKDYSPYKVRVLLEEMDDPEALVRQNLYGFYSSYGTHPNARGLMFIARDNAVEIGPFVDQHRLVGLTGDLTRMSVMAATHLGLWLVISGIDLVEDEAFDQIGGLLETINARFLELGALLQQIPGHC